MTFTVTVTPAPHLPAATLSTILNKQIGSASIAELQAVQDALSRIGGATTNPAATIAAALPGTTSV
jgi:hypothetical protein